MCPLPTISLSNIKLSGSGFTNHHASIYQINNNFIYFVKKIYVEYQIKGAFTCTVFPLLSLILENQITYNMYSVMYSTFTVKSILFCPGFGLMDLYLGRYNFPSTFPCSLPLMSMITLIKTEMKNIRSRSQNCGCDVSGEKRQAGNVTVYV